MIVNYAFTTLFDSLRELIMFHFSQIASVLSALMIGLCCLAGCDLATVAEIAGNQAQAEEDHEWGPFRMGMSLDEVQNIIKAKTGKPGEVVRLPGSKWDSITYQDKMIMLMDGVVLTVMAEEHEDPDLKLDP
jgi:hypothetical protein